MNSKHSLPSTGNKIEIQKGIKQLYHTKFLGLNYFYSLLSVNIQSNHWSTLIVQRKSILRKNGIIVYIAVIFSRKSNRNKTYLHQAFTKRKWEKNTESEIAIIGLNFRSKVIWGISQCRKTKDVGWVCVLTCNVNKTKTIFHGFSSFSSSSLPFSIVYHI